MSLVERALAKMRESGRTTAPEAIPAVTKVEPPPPTVAKLAPDPREQEGGGSSKIVKVNRTALRAYGLLAPEDQERRLADEYRQIKRPIVANALGRGVEKLPKGHLVMVASAIPGEGKTFSSINLALSLSLEKDVHVLLVDADVAKPHITRTFGLESEPGLLDVLRNEQLRVRDLIVRTDVPGLSILPAGTQSDTATELLASERMEQIAKQLGSWDSRLIVLFDSPPLLLTSESRALASVVGQVVLVVRAGSTTQQMVQEAIGYLGEGPAIGLVLNQCEMEAKTGYYYGYGSSSASSGR